MRVVRKLSEVWPGLSHWARAGIAVVSLTAAFMGSIAALQLGGALVARSDGGDWIGFWGSLAGAAVGVFGVWLVAAWQARNEAAAREQQALDAHLRAAAMMNQVATDLLSAALPAAQDTLRAAGIQHAWDLGAEDGNKSANEALLSRSSFGGSMWRREIVARSKRLPLSLLLGHELLGSLPPILVSRLMALQRVLRKSLEDLDYMCAEDADGTAWRTIAPGNQPTAHSVYNATMALLEIHDELVAIDRNKSAAMSTLKDREQEMRAWITPVWAAFNDHDGPRLLELATRPGP